MQMLGVACPRGHLEQAHPQPSRAERSEREGLVVEDDKVVGSEMPENDRIEELTSQGHLLFSPSAVVFALSPEHRRQAARCLSNNGEIRISFNEIAITDLTGIRVLNGDGGVAVD